MRIVLLFPDMYSLKDIFKTGFEQLGHEVEFIHYENFFPKIKNRWQNKVTGLPRKLRQYWQEPYILKVNALYLKRIKELKPDLILVYNDQLLLPETANQIKSICPIFTYLGDNPFYVFQRPYNISLLQEVDQIFAPDSFWLEQLNQIGLNNTEFLIMGYSDKLNYTLTPSESELNKYSSDLLMIGRTYNDSWGYKRALFYSKFTDMDIKIYGNGWNRWFHYFPKLKTKCVSLDKPLTLEEVNILSNCCKIYPIDANPGLLNGIHVRIFDSIGSGILPIAEYRSDISKVFGDKNIPVIKDYNKAGDQANYYLKNESERLEIIQALKQFVSINYVPSVGAKRIIDKLNKR